MSPGPPREAVRISAIICTRDRAPYLRRAIRSLRGQTLGHRAYEVLVVDNGSTDGTGELVAAESGRWPNLRYLAEPVLGLSRARNRGWRSARGEYVAYLDDDATAAPDWLARILAVFDTVAPRPGCVGGRIEPLWEAPRPAWLSDDLLGALSILDWSAKPGVLRPDRWIAGCNMAFPRRLLRAVGGFSERLGRRGERLLSMEENLVRQQLEGAGYVCYYDPRIVVQHHIPATRLAPSWFLRRTYWNGVSAARVQVMRQAPSRWRRWWRAGRAAAALTRNARTWTDLLSTGRDPERFARGCAVAGRIGYAVGLWAAQPALPRWDGEG